MPETDHLRPYVAGFLDSPVELVEDIEAALVSVPAVLWPDFETAAKQEITNRLRWYERERARDPSARQLIPAAGMTHQEAREYSRLLLKKAHLAIEGQRRMRNTDQAANRATA